VSVGAFDVFRQKSRAREQITFGFFD